MKKRMDRGTYAAAIISNISRILTASAELDEAERNLKELLPIVDGSRLIDALKSPPMLCEKCERPVMFAIDDLCSTCRGAKQQAELKQKVRAELEAEKRAQEPANA